MPTFKINKIRIWNMGPTFKGGGHLQELKMQESQWKAEISEIPNEYWDSEMLDFRHLEMLKFLNSANANKETGNFLQEFWNSQTLRIPVKRFL